jgi:Zn-dependent protease
MHDSTVADLLALTADYIQIDGFYTQRDELHLRGLLLTSDREWQEVLRERLKPLGFTSRIQQEGLAVHLTIMALQSRLPVVNVLLFLATVVSVTVFPGYWAEGSKFFQDASLFVHWLGFSLPLLAILLFHEFGHYFAARRRGIPATLPYFIPFPNIIGTFGAFIKMKAAINNRQSLLEVGAWGPLAGFVVAVVFLAWGLQNVSFSPRPETADAVYVIEPLIFRLIQLVTWVDSAAPDQVITFQENPMLMAAWVGLFVTAMNLLPAGQLDGGHIVYALFPRNHRRVSFAVLLSLAGLGLLWPGWWLWAILLYFVVRLGHPPTLDETAPLGLKSRLLGWSAIVVFALTFTPVPF